MAYLELKDLTVEFSGFRAVDEVSININKGELRVIIGPNGAGKTTIIDMITGKTRPTAGSIILEGKNITGMESDKISSQYKIGRKFQGPNIFDNMTVYENVEVALAGHNKLLQTLFYCHTKKVDDEINAILKQINLYGQRDLFAVSLSHGQKQWLEIGMVMAQKPEVITLDEPTSGMTADETYKTGELIKTVMKGKTVIVIEHDIDFVKQIAEKITVLNHGQILAEGTYDEVTANPEVIKVYLKTDDEEEKNA
jgi:urea transport system ATP-binding protein